MGAACNCVDRIGGSNVETGGIIAPEKCNKECPTCCDETVAEIHARAEARKSDRALSLSSAVTLIYVFANLWSAILGDGKAIPLPDFVWVVIVAPWVGAGGSKIVNTVMQKIEEKKQ